MRRSLKICVLIFVLIAWGAVVAPSCHIDNQSISDTNQTNNKKTANYSCPSFGTLFVRKVFDVAHGRDKELTALSTLAIAVFTVILAVASGLQFCGVMMSIRESKRAAKVQARLTRHEIALAREEFNATHRPKIRIHAIEFQRVPNTEGDDDWDRVGAIFLCFNTGESPAKNVEARGQILAVANTPINVQRPIVKLFPVIESGQKFIFEINSDWLVRELFQRQDMGLPSFKCVGTVVYFDGNGTRRETAFYRELVLASAGERWDSAKSPQHEYEY